MHFRVLLVVSLLLLTVPVQSQTDALKAQFQAAEAQHRAGNLVQAEAQFTSMLAESYQKLGRIYTVQNKYQDSVGVLETSISYRPQSRETLVDLSIAYFFTRQYKRAIEPLERAIAIDAKSAAAHHMLGKSYFMLGEFDRAVSELELALKLAPKDYDVAYTLALAHLQRQQLIPAKQIFNRMITQLGNRPQLRVLIGRGYRETGFLAEALEEFKRAIALDPKFPRVHYYLGLTYLLKDGATRLKAAEAEFKIELAEHPDEYFANYYLGIIATIERKWDEAVRFLQKASKAQPQNPDPYFYLGQSYQGLGKHEQAIEVFKQAIAFNPDLRHNDYQVTNAHYRLAQSLMKVGQVDEGKKELVIAADLKSKAFKRDEARAEAFINSTELKPETDFPDLIGTGGIVAEATKPQGDKKLLLDNETNFYQNVIAAAHNNLGILRAEQQDYKKAADHFQLAAKWNPALKDIFYNLGLASYKSQSFKEAIAAFERELQLNPNNLQAKELLGLSYFASEAFERAALTLSEVLNAKPTNAALYYPLALSLGKLGKTDAVNEVVQRMLAVGGNNPQVRLVLARAYYEQGDGPKALEELKAALALDNRILLAHFYSGLVLLKLGKFDEAAREFEAELALNPSDLQAKYHLGYVLLSNQNTKRGMELLREVIRDHPDFGNAYFELGKAQLQQGDVQGAVMSLEKAAKLVPEEAHVYFQLGRAYLAAGRQADSEVQLEKYKQLKDKARTQTNP